MELTVLNIKGENTGKKVTLDEIIFNQIPNNHAIYLDVKQHLANKRQGTHSSLEKSTISGSTKKIKRQKGTGSARAGSRKSPLFRGGARAFGPLPRDYSFKLNKKLKRIARISALSFKYQEDKIMIVEDFSFDTPKTKSYTDILKSLNINNSKTLMILPDVNQNIILSARNIPNAKIMRASDINTYEILRAKQLIITENSLEEIKKTLDINSQSK